MTAQVAIYVQGGYAKPGYKSESYQSRLFPGVEMVRDALERSGISVAYCSASTVTRYRVILVSLISDCDWWTYIAERRLWPRGDYRVIVGGPGVLNIRPFLPWADYFVFGRGEKVAVDLVRGILQDVSIKTDSVASSSDFRADQSYTLAQALQLYPHPVRLPGGETVSAESTIGCQQKCLFCAYSWHRQHIGGMQSEANALASGEEHTLLEVDLEHPETWNFHNALFGLDGWSERLRFMVNKPITKERFVSFLQGLRFSSCKPNMIKLFSLVGIPSESAEDMEEFVACLRQADDQDYRGTPWPIRLQLTPMRPMPATPSALWPASTQDYRQIGDRLKRICRTPRSAGELLFYDGNLFKVYCSFSIDSLATTALSMICLRVTEDDTDNIERISASPRFWRGSKKDQLATLAAHFNLDRLFGAYTEEDNPTRYLQSHAPSAGMAKMGRHLMQKYANSPLTPELTADAH